MQSNNFQPLKSRWDDLFKHASFAEAYVYTDPHTATIKLRCFAETLVGILYRELNLPSESDDGFFERLQAPVFRDIVGEVVFHKLHAIRLLGNKAAHGQHIETKTALSLLKEAYLIGQWFYKTYSREATEDYPSYLDPMNPSSQFGKQNQGVEKLAEQLAAAKEELARLEASEKAAQAEVAVLNESLDQTKLGAFKSSATQAAKSIDFKSANTRNLISIQDAFAEYILNDGQTELLNQLGRFLNNNEESVFLLRGYAGTGKTFITKGLTEYFDAIGRNYVLAAPTGKASKVIANKTNSPAYTVHKIIYSFDDIAEYREDDIDGTETFKFYANLRVNEHSVDTVYIVDEASMVSDIYQEAEFFRFGSGHLLTDFLKYVNLDHNDHKKKVIFIGDNAQLPPVGMKDSPALNAVYLSDKHNVCSTGFELTEVVRQKSESGVLKNAIQLRKALQARVFNQLDIDLNHSDMDEVSHQNLLTRYLESCGNKINGEAIVIAHSNADVASYNRRIRQHFFPGQEEVMPGDKVMAVANSNTYGILISNGDFGLIRKVFGNQEKRTITLKRKVSDSGKVEEILVPLAFRDVEIGFRDIEGVPHFFKAKILEDLLASREPNFSSDQTKALYLDFCIRNNHLPSKSLEFKNSLKSDPYFNALRLKYGYAITCHKAQGSEWNHVFLHCKSHQSQLSAEYFRWFYTAITRTSKKLYLLDPPRLKLAGNLKPVTCPGLSFQPEGGRTPDISPASVAPTTTIVDEIEAEKTYDIPESAAFLLAILKNVRALIKEKGIVIDGIAHNQYQEAYSFSRGDAFARVNIGYSSRSKVTNVIAPQLTDFSAELVDVLSQLRGFDVQPEPNEELAFEKPFLNEFHKKVLDLCVNRRIVVKNVAPQQWSQRYTFTRDGEFAVYDIWYDGRSRFTKFQPVITACSPGTLVGDVNILLTEDMRL